MKFLIDVCVSRRVSDDLQEAGFEVVFVCDSDPRMPDEQILAWAAREQWILVTNDKDFGKHIFLHQQPHSGMVRLPSAEGNVLVSLMRQIIEAHADDLAAGAIVTATASRIRIRKQ